MRSLIGLVLVAAVAWCGYWAIGKSGVHDGFETWFEDRRTDGWVAEYETLDVRGFPNRFDTFFTEVELADPETGWAWVAPFFQIFSLSYQPGHVIAVWPHQQTLATPLETLTVESTDMRASLVLEHTPKWPLNRATLTADGVKITPVDASESTKIASLTLAAEQASETEPLYRLGLSATEFAPSLPMLEIVDPQQTLPNNLETVQVDMTVTFDKPWDLNAIEEERPQPQEIKIRLAKAKWGRLLIQMAGELIVLPDGTPEGDIMIKAKNWREILELATAAGALPESIAQPLEDGLALISQLAGNPETLDIPLTFENAKIKIGPVPIGPAPVIQLR